MQLRGLLMALVVGVGLSFTARPVHAQAPEQIQWSTAHWQGDTAVARRFDGTTVELSLQRTLQSKTKQLIRNARPIAGAAALIDVASGAIVAMTEFGNTAGGSLLFDPVAPAASVFKLVTTTALYERTNVTPSHKVCTNGGLRRIELEHLVPARGQGAVCSPLSQALGHSRNAVFAQLATQRLMRTELLEIAEALGFNRSLPCDVPARLGLLEVPYNDLAFARTAAGFENSQLSVLGAAHLMLTVARGGELHPIHLAHTAEPSPEPLGRAFSKRTASRLTQMLEVTVRNGTSAEAFQDKQGRSYLAGIRVAGKTGTLKPSASSPTSSWFAGFAPSRKPRVVVSVLLQNPDEWHRKANQVARDLLRVYFSEQGAPGVTAPL